MGSLVVSAVAVLENEKQKAKEGDNSGWISALVSIVVLLFTIVGFGFFAWRRGRALAKLLHEKAVAEEEVHQAEVDKELAVLREEQARADIQLTEAQERLLLLQQEETRLREEYTHARQTLDSIVSWDDVDRYLSSPREGATKP